MTVSRYVRDCANQVQSLWVSLDQPHARLSDWKVIQLAYKVTTCSVFCIVLLGAWIRLWIERKGNYS